MAWIPSKEEVDVLLLYIVNTTRTYIKTPDTVKHLPNPVKMLEKHAGEIGQDSFTAGLDLVLMYACSRGCSQLVSCILRCCRQGLQIDRNYKYVFVKRVCVYQTSVLTSHITGTLTVTDLLQEDAVSRISRSNTLLHLAAEGNHLSVVQLLIKASAFIDPVNCCGQTPLMLGIKSFRVTKALISAGANVNLRDKHGSTALLIAVEAGAPAEVVALLLDNGSDHCIRDNSGCSFLHKIYCLKKVSVNYNRVLLQKKLLLTCSDSGLLLSSGVPLCITSIGPRLLEELDESQFLGKDVRLSLKFLKPALCLVNIACLEDRRSEYKSALCEALQFKDYHKLKLQYPPPTAAYQSLQEVTTSSMLFDGITDNQLIFQNLIIVERVAGYGSFVLIWLIIDTLSNISDYFQKCLLLQHAIDMLLHRLNEHGCTDRRVAVITTTLIGSMASFISEGFHSNKSSVILKMATNLLSCVKHNLKMFDRVHSHHAVTVTSESMYRYCAFRGDSFNMAESALNLLFKLLLHCQFDMKGLMTEFLQDLPLIVGPYDEIHSILSLACIHNKGLVRLMLECGGDQWMHTRILKGDFLINLLLDRYKGSTLSRQPLSKENISLADNLLELGMHLDCVDSNNVPLYANLPKELCHHVAHYGGNVLLPLTCITAKVIVSKDVPYWDACLPRRVKEFIGLHDPKSFQRQMKDILDLP